MKNQPRTRGQKNMEVTNHFIVYKLKLKLLFLKRLNCSNMQDLPLMILVFFIINKYIA